MIKNMIFDGKPILFTPNEDKTWRIDKETIINNDGEPLFAKFSIPRCNVNFNTFEILTSSDNSKELWNITIPEQCEESEHYDFLGNRLYIGDTVVCLVYNKTSAALHKGSITKLNPKTLEAKLLDCGDRERRFDYSKVVKIQN